jgi:hypothetical protein
MPLKTNIIQLFKFIFGIYFFHNISGVDIYIVKFLIRTC